MRGSSSKVPCCPIQIIRRVDRDHLAKYRQGVIRRSDNPRLVGALGLIDLQASGMQSAGQQVLVSLHEKQGAAASATEGPLTRWHLNALCCPIRTDPIRDLRRAEMDHIANRADNHPRK